VGQKKVGNHWTLQSTNPLLTAETNMRQMFSTALVLTDVIVGPRRWDHWCINTAVAILVSDLQSSVWCCRFI